MGARFDRRPSDYRDVAKRECFSLELSLASLPASRARINRGGSARAISALNPGRLVCAGDRLRIPAPDLLLSSNEGRGSAIQLRPEPNERGAARSRAPLPERLSAAGNGLPNRNS